MSLTSVVKLLMPVQKCSVLASNSRFMKQNKTRQIIANESFYEAISSGVFSVWMVTARLRLSFRGIGPDSKSKRAGWFNCSNGWASSTYRLYAKATRIRLNERTNSWKFITIKSIGKSPGYGPTLRLEITPPPLPLSGIFMAVDIPIVGDSLDMS